MRVGGSEYLKRPEENQEGERGFVGGGCRDRGWPALEGSEQRELL